MLARVFRDQARQKLCYHHIAGRDIADWALAEARDFVRAEASAHVAIAAGLVPEPYDGDEKLERKLATLLWRWTCPRVAWPSFMQCNESEYNIGTHMWTVIMNRYQLRTSTKVGDHVRLLQKKQEPCEKIQDFWVTSNTAHAYMLSAGRLHVYDIDSCGLIKDNVLPFHMSWTPLIDPLVTSKSEL